MNQFDSQFLPELSRKCLVMFREGDKMGYLDPDLAYCFTLGENGFNLVASHGDVYELIEHVKSSRGAEVQSAQCFGIWTRGWAAPLSDDESHTGPPSLHPDRKRVLMACLVSADSSMATAMFINNEVIVDTGDASGMLEGALRSIFEKTAYVNN